MLFRSAFYFFPDVSAYFGKQYNGKTYANAAELSIFLLEEAHVAVVGGDSFGDDNCIRLSYAAAEDKLREAVKRIKDAFAKLS